MTTIIDGLNRIMQVTLGFVVMIIMTVSQAWATAQISDQLIYQGKTQPLFSEPLEHYFNADHKRLNKLFASTCTACWRGYVATWKIENKALYLISLVKGTCGSDGDAIPLSKVIPNAESPVKAIWYSGTLRVPQGEMLEYIHAGYATRYEKDLLIDVRKGVVIGERIRDNRKLNPEKSME